MVAASPQVDQAPQVAGAEEEYLLDAYLELEGEELAWLGYADEKLVQTSLASALDVTGSG